LEQRPGNLVLGRGFSREPLEQRPGNLVLGRGFSREPLEQRPGNLVLGLGRGGVSVLIRRLSRWSSDRGTSAPSRSGVNLYY
jgi:hypothetical protein